MIALFDLPKPNICGDDTIHVPTLEPCDDCERLEREFEEARQQAIDAAASAESSAARAEEAADNVLDLNVESVTLPPGSDAYVNKTIEGEYYLLTFGIPKGNTGDTGADGATGNGIASIQKTGTQGLVDTYTITFTNGSTSTFTVTNGRDGTGSGTVSEVGTGAGLTGGPVTTTGTIKAKMVRDTNGALVSASPTEVAGRQYPVVPDANGDLSVNVPWNDGNDLIADEYSASSTYAVGDYCIHDGQFYRCTTAISTAEAWNSAHWTEVTVADELTDVKGDIPQNVSDLNNDAGYQTASQVATAVNDDRPIWLDVPSFSSFPQTITDSRITSTMRVALIYFGTPSAVTSSGIDWTTSAGSVTITGSIIGSTTATLKLEEPRT